MIYITKEFWNIYMSNNIAYEGANKNSNRAIIYFFICKCMKISI